MDRTYLDSSIILSCLLREEKFEKLNLDHQGELISSELLDLECRRTLDRIRIHEHLTNEAVADRLKELETSLKSIRLIRLSPPIFQRAKAPFSTVVRSLDALHLATAELVRAKVFLSFDKQQVTAAKALGFSTP